MTQATIIVPTFDHGPTLRWSVASALRQTIRDIEVIIIGDGVPDAARSIVAELIRADERVRFIDVPKHESRAEPARHAAVVGARGKIVCYLSDDDLYLPRHVEMMLARLQEADFAHALPVCVDACGRAGTLTVDLERAEHRRLIAEAGNRIPLTAGAHTREAYLRLPDGWGTPPADTRSDHHMWRKFLAQPGCRFASIALPTILVFPSLLRRAWSMDERVAELERWWQRIDGTGWEALVEDLLQQTVREAARSDGICWAQHLALGEITRALDAERAALAVARTQLALTQRRPETAVLRIMERLRGIARRLPRLSKFVANVAGYSRRGHQ